MKSLNGSLLRPLEEAIINKMLPLVPSCMGTKAITFLSLFSSMGVLTAYYLCQNSSIFLFLATLFILMQWAFDCLDGAVGRARNEGFVKWGYFMDHLFDYFFMSSVIGGLYFLFTPQALQIAFLFFIAGAYMVTFFLAYAADRQADFKISFNIISPIEFRLLAIGFNTLLYFYPVPVKIFVSKYLFIFNILLLVLLALIVYFQQEKMDKSDRSIRSLQ